MLRGEKPALRYVRCTSFLIDYDELTDNEEKVLKLIEQKPQITAQEISEVLDVSLRHAKRLISGLKDKGFIAHEGPNKTGNWTVIRK